MKKEKIKPPVLRTREGMEAEVAEYVRLKLRHVAVTAQMEEMKARVEKKYSGELNELGRSIELKFAAVQNYCMVHRAELVDEKRKSFSLVNAEVGFRTSPPAVAKRSSKETWEDIATRLQGLELQGPDGASILDCGLYVREPAPQVDKAALLADRAIFTPDMLRIMGLEFTQEENFYIEPKSEVASGDSREAA